MHRLVERFLFEMPDEPFAPRFNIAPSQTVAGLRLSAPGQPRQLCALRWGLIPSWSKDLLIGYKMINARSETVDTKPSFRQAFKFRRCLILADGYYEWQKVPATTQKQPYHIRLQDDGPFAFAGLWETWQSGDGSALESCTIITTEANELTRHLHPRMPVILPPDAYDSWLDPASQDPTELKALLSPYPADQMTVSPVSTLVNNPRNDQPQCLVPVVL